MVMATDQASYEDLQHLHMAAGRIVEVQDFPRARKPTYKVRVDFGSHVGERWSCLQAKEEYTQEEMLGRVVIAVLNLPPKNIAGFRSEVLILGVPAEDGSLSLLVPSRGATLGGQVY